jgi:NADH:ubiquinone oxidoreductase subunit 3 (subunit A)
MNSINLNLFTPPIAFIVYLLLVGALSLLGKGLAGPTKPNITKSSTYASGEAPPTGIAAPGYRPFFVIALFFAILHLGILMLGSGNFSTATLVYLIGLALALLALVLG